MLGYLYRAPWCFCVQHHGAALILFYEAKSLRKYDKLHISRKKLNPQVALKKQANPTHPVILFHSTTTLDDCWSHRTMSSLCHFSGVAQTDNSFRAPGNPAMCTEFTFQAHSFAVALSHPLPLPGWWSDYPVVMCVSRQVRGQCVCKGLAGFSINTRTGLATFPRSANNLRGGESGWSISSVCLLRSRPTLIP